MMTAQETQTAREEILDIYDKDQLHDIAYHGCISGCASHHITYQETNQFYDKHEEEILDFLNMINYTTETCLSFFGGDADDIKQLKNNLTWSFIEGLAQEVTLEDD